MVWERARGVHVWDADGKKYLDLTGAFGVAAAGHRHPRVLKAGQRQMATLMHAMGDVHPHALKAELARELSRVTFERWKYNFGRKTLGRTEVSSGKTIFCNSGFEAVEAALKTALLATGKAGVIAFTGGYHGLGYGALNATHREHFRSRFEAQLGGFGHFAPFPNNPAQLPTLEASLHTLFRRQRIGAILVEPIQVRGGINVPPVGFLPLLRRLADDHRACLIIDEIYTGFGRTGKWFACEHSQTIPDLICLGKALTGGFPLSACVGSAELIDSAWPRSTGEAIHTSTFLGHPVGCAMALAQIAEIRTNKLADRSAVLGKALLADLQELEVLDCLRVSARGVGLLAGMELNLGEERPATDITLGSIKLMLQRGYVLLPEGEHSNVISFTPPLTISGNQLHQTVRVLNKVLRQLCGGRHRHV